MTNQEEKKTSTLQANKREEWYPAIPLPYKALKYRCYCGKKFWFEKNYEAHYALEHIIRATYPL